jgi:hypothetical protein
MADITVSLPDGSTRALSPGATTADIGPGLAKAALVVTVDGDVRDLDRVLPDRSTVAIVTSSSDEGLHTIRHSTAHVLAESISWSSSRLVSRLDAVEATVEAIQDSMDLRPFARVEDVTEDIENI